MHLGHCAALHLEKRVPDKNFRQAHTVENKITNSSNNSNRKEQGTREVPLVTRSPFLAHSGAILSVILEIHNISLEL